MTIEELLEKYKKKYPGVPYERMYTTYIFSVKNEELHSYGDAPAIVYKDEEKRWYKEGKVHRENDKPAVISDGTKEWWYKDKRHRENDKPAVIYSDGAKQWWYEGKAHRENGKPAVIFPNGRKEYYLNGKQYVPSEESIKQINKLTTKKSSKQKQREDLLKEFVNEMLGV